MVDYNGKMTSRKFLKQSGAANTPTIFLFTDSEIKEESFVEDINNLLKHL
jgi:dynein heavy chain